MFLLPAAAVAVAMGVSVSGGGAGAVFSEHCCGSQCRCCLSVVSC